ncbi:MAG: hypothetical protein ACRC41_14460 [Sarcina sp.]
MTIFYSIYTGEIKLVSTGDVDFDVFCNNELDMKSFCNRVKVERNDFILKEPYKYKVNIQEGSIELKESFMPVKIMI